MRKKHRRTKRRREHGGAAQKTNTKLNCHPAVVGHQVAPDTCLTPAAVQEIKEAYNRQDRGPALTHKDPKGLYQELKQVMAPVCKDQGDACLLDQLPPETKKDLDKKVFAPFQPREWQKNPKEWLSNYDIMHVLKQYQEKYAFFRILGPTPIDFDTRLPEAGNRCVETSLCHFNLKQMMEKGVRKVACVFNLSAHDEDGSHWVTLFIDVSNRNAPFMFFFDSAVNGLPDEIKSLVDRIRDQGNALGLRFAYHENHLMHQRGDTECGMYSLYFIITLLTGRTALVNHNRRMTQRQLIRLFLKKRIPDHYVEQFRTVYFNVR